MTINMIQAHVLASKKKEKRLRIDGKRPEKSIKSQDEEGDQQKRGMYRRNCTKQLVDRHGTA